VNESPEPGDNTTMTTVGMITPYYARMELVADNWQVLLIVLGIAILVLGLIRKLMKLAFIGIGLAVLAAVAIPLVSG